MRLANFLFAAFILIIAVAPATKADAQTFKYVDPQFGFTLRYPQTATVQMGGDNGITLAATTLDVAFTLMLPPVMLQPSTNLIKKPEVDIGVSADPAVVSTCTAAAPSRGEKATGTAIIGDARFARFTIFDAAMGTQSESTVYRAVRAGTCYELVEFLEYHNIDDYTPGTVRPLDEAKIMDMLEAITQSFAFAR